MNTTSPMKILGEEDYGKETSDTENENHFKYEKGSERRMNIQSRMKVWMEIKKP